MKEFLEIGNFDHSDSSSAKYYSSAALIGQYL